MTEDKKNRPISWAATNTSYVVEEVKKREQSQDVSKQTAPIVNRKKRNSSEREKTFDMLEGEQNGI